MPFPNNPNLGDTYTENGTTYVYTSYGWQRSVVAAGNETTYTGRPNGGGGGGTVTGVTGTAPITSSGGSNPTISTSIATNKLLGRGTAGTGVVEEITLGTNLSLSGTTLNATGGGGATSPGGSTTQVQFNDGGVFGGDSGLTYNKTTNTLTVGVSSADPGTAIVKGDINLDDGGSFTTTLQTITPTANRTISLPDATGTVALVGGSSGQLLWNNAGVNAGASTLTYDGSILTTSGRFINSYNATASAPAKAFTGTWFTGGTATTTKPQVLIEPTGTTSTAWSTSGTGLGVNAASGFAGNLLDLQVNGTSFAKCSSDGSISARTSIRLWDAGAVVCGINQTNGNELNIFAGGTNLAQFRTSTITLASNVAFGFGSATSIVAGSSPDTILTRDAANTLAQRNGTNAQVFRVYNTYTSSTNYELGKLEWTSNVFRIGTEKGSGGGTARTVEVHTDSIARLALDTTGSVRVVTGLTVATLPGTPAVGMVARVTDATAPAVGSTVAGGGAAAALVWYNGTNWTVIGV